MRTMTGLRLFGLMCALVGCADPPPDDDLHHDEDIDPAFFHEEGGVVLKAAMSTVGELARSGACSTSPAQGLTLQIADEVACLRPGLFTRIDSLPNVTFSAGANPFLQPDAAASLESASRRVALHVNSTWRSVAQQYLLKSWEGRCGIRVAASPGRSNHESGLAVDVDEYESSVVRGALRDADLTWYCSETNGGRLSGCGDPVHFTNYGGEDLRASGVKAFQRLWNRNNPSDRIAEDGAYGPQTAERLRRAPLTGFASGANCGAAPPAPAPAAPTAAPAPAPADAGACDGMPVDGRCAGTVAQWCENGALKQNDCARSGQGCGYTGPQLGFYCLDAAAAPPPAEAPPAPENDDAAWNPDGACTPAPQVDFTPADTGGNAGEGVFDCVRRISRADENTMDCRYPEAGGAWYLTTFGGGSDTQPVSCGGRQADGRWFYAANAQRFPCGSRFKLRTGRGCVVVQVADSGPHVCVEDAAAGPIWDVSPVAARALTGSSQVGWSERVTVTSEPVSAATPLGTCR
jgi:hypothetical protein